MARKTMYEMIMENMDQFDAGLPPAHAKISYRSAAFHGTMGDVIKKIEEHLTNMGSFEDYLQLYIHSPRLIKGVIDNCSVYGGEDALKLKSAAVDLCSSVFAADFEAAYQKLPKIKELMFNMGDLASVGFTEKPDLAAWETIGHLEKTINLIQSHPLDFDCIVMAGHGSYRNGFIIANESLFEPYPIRVSTYKEKDTKPVLFGGELNSIKRFVEGKNVLLYDTDMYDGTTMALLLNFFLSDVGTQLNIETCVSDVLENTVAGPFINLPLLKTFPKIRGLREAKPTAG